MQYFRGLFLQCEFAIGDILVAGEASMYFCGAHCSFIYLVIQNTPGVSRVIDNQVALGQKPPFSKKVFVKKIKLAKELQVEL